MKRPSILFLFICVNLLSFNTHAQHLPLTDNPLKTKLDFAVQQAAIGYLRDSSTHDVVIGVINSGKRYYYRYTNNLKGISQLPQNGLHYNIGSVAKTFVATILAQAVIDKKVKLQDDIRKYLPGSYTNLQYKGILIKLVDLANHTSGLPGTFHQYSANAMNNLKGKSLSDQANFFATYNTDSLLLDLHTIGPDTIPGTKFRYNSSAYMLLTLLLEKIYKKPYEEIVTTYLKEKLNMAHTTPLLINTELRKTAQGYDRTNKPVEYINLKGYYIGPNMNSTINDMTTYVEAQLTAKDPAINLTQKQTFGNEDGFGIGMGWMMNNKEGERYFYHSGNTKIGFNTLCTIYPKSQLGIIIIVNDVTSQENVEQLENNIRLLLR